MADPDHLLEADQAINRAEIALGEARTAVAQAKGFAAAFPPESEATAPAPAPGPLAAPSDANGGIQHAEAFFAAIRGPGKLWATMTASQVSGVSAMLAAGAGVLPLSWMAYVLATGHLETGGAMVPNVENLNYSAEALTAKFGNRISAADAQRFGRTKAHPADQHAIANIIYGGAWGAANLGNTQPGDGWNMRGRGWAMITGRRNYQKADDALGLGGSLVANPDRLLELAICAGATIRGMVEGWFTGRSLREFLPVEAGLAHYKNARRVINGQDRADDIAETAEIFEAALKVGGWL